MQGTSTDAAEVARFGRLAEEWWNESGPMRPLHRMNATRIAWIRARIHEHFPDPAGLGLIDVGCGAGLATEALARQGFSVLGIDPSPPLIRAAIAHAEGRRLPLRYRVGVAEQLAGEGLRFPVVTALEVIEHVAEPDRFLAAIAMLAAPGGLVFLSTINRTLKSLLVAKIGAEYLLRLLPPGTHDWRRFIPPSEMERLLTAAGLRMADIAGMTFDPLCRRWRESHDLSVNYILMAGA